MKEALICIDFINEIIDLGGKLSVKGYSDFAQKNNSFENIKELLNEWRTNNKEVIHIRLQFKGDYINQPKQSLLFGKAQDFGILQENTWSTDFFHYLKPIGSEKIFSKSRVSAFFNTNLHNYLQEKGITHLTIIGVATDLAVESTVRDAHDRDYIVHVIGSCCIASNSEDHGKSLKFMQKIAEVL